MIAAIRAPTGEFAISEVLLVLAIILASAKIAGELAERFRQPAVLGELLVGVLLGASLLGIVDPSVPAIHLLSEIGVVILLFAIGLETDLRKLVRVGPASSLVAVTGVVLPFGLGYFAARAFGVGTMAAVVTGAAMTATSVGITARVLGDLNALDSDEGQVVLGAAVIDDVLGLIILAIVAKVVAGGELTAAGAFVITAKAFGFLILAIGAGMLIMPQLLRLLARVGKPETLPAVAVAIAFLFATLADLSGSALIIGAFAAGVAMQPTPQSHSIATGVIRFGHFFVPIFFVAVGAAVDVRQFADPRVLALGSVLVVVGFVGKYAAGFAPFWVKCRKSMIGIGMVPRGEVGLIFAQTGLASGALLAGEFGAIMLMVIVTTFVAPVLLRRSIGGTGGGTNDGGAISDLTMES